ncbi:MAG: hypothetical protein RRY34_11365, partial [Victivallaceae bacterium]
QDAVSFAKNLLFLVGRPFRLRGKCGELIQPPHPLKQGANALHHAASALRMQCVPSTLSKRNGILQKRCKVSFIVWEN